MSDSQKDWLESQWHELLAPFNIPLPLRQAALDGLFAAYSVPTRFYHNLDHIAEVLRAISELISEAKMPVSIRLAAWYHDCVYDSKDEDNEERSCCFAAAALKELSLIKFVESVGELIMATKRHDATNLDAAILIDADLAILGASPDRYDSYSRAIREEYAWVTDGAYRTGRSGVLRRFLKRDAIYFTELMHRRLEAQARENITRELASLQRA
jgi:predicted metal-dependent HD superfamily phosphohydrolase